VPCARAAKDSSRRITVEFRAFPKVVLRFWSFSEDYDGAPEIVNILN